MRVRRNTAALALMLLVALGCACAAQSDSSGLPSVEERLAGFADRMQLGLSIASVAVFSPTLRDAHGQAERLIDLLRSSERDPIPGLLSQAEAFPDWIRARSFAPDALEPLLGAATDVQGFLRLAVEAAISADRARALADATDDLLRVYACLFAAWGQPVDGIVVPGLVTILHAFGVLATG